MGLTWNLDGLYSSFEDKKFESDLQKLTEIAEGTTDSINELLNSQKSDIEIIETYLKESEEVRNILAPVASFSRLSFSADSTNASALNNLQKIQGLNASLIPGEVMFAKWLVNRDLNALLPQSELLQAYEFYLNNIISNEKYALDESTESIIEQLRQTGSRAFDTLQKKISSGMTEEVEIDGKTEVLPLQSIRNLAFEKDPNKRIAGYHAEMKVYKKNEEASASAMNGIKGESLTLNKLRGYKSPLEKTLINSYMNQETLDAMISAMQDSLPKFREYYKRKAELLGHKNGLPLYDIFAPMGDGDITFPYEKGQELVLEQFGTFSGELRDFAKKAFDNDWIDVAPRKGKAGGAFCAPVLSLKESRILLNYTGKLNNAITLAHELGHGFHNYNLFNEKTLNIGSPMPLAETASIFCETIVKNAALKNADSEAKFSILEVAIQGYSQVIVDIYSRFLFESKVFEARKNGALSPDQLKQFMTEAQLESYGDGLDPEFMHPYMWMNKTHYYIPDLDYYNFPYAFGLLFAEGIYAKYKAMGESFVPKLNTLLRSTGKMDVIHVAKQMDIDVTDKAFWQTSLNEISAEIDEFIKLSK